MLNQILFFLRSSLMLLVLVGVGLAQLEELNDQTASNRNYKIGVGDVLNVVVTKQDLLSLNGLRVSNEGTIKMPMIQERINAACLTEMELADVLVEKYRKLVLEPDVFVAVTEFNSNPVSLMGAVSKPGRFDVRRPARLLEMLALVNGPAANAGDTIQIIRKTDGTHCVDQDLVARSGEGDQEIISIPLAETLRGSFSANPLVQSGDIITIPVADAPKQAYIIGRVQQAQAITLNEPTSISMAIAKAGGLARGAEESKIRLVRLDPETNAKSEIIVNLKDIDDQKADDIILQANDIVEVPGPKGTKKFFYDLYRSIVPIVTRGIIPVY